MPTTKTAISVPSRLFEKIDKLSKRLRISRSRLFSRAAEEFLERRNAEELVERLNQAYSERETAAERKLRHAAAGAFRRLLENPK